MNVRLVEKLPPVERVSELLVVPPAVLIANKVIVREHRRDTPKSGTDWRDLAMLLLTFPEPRAIRGRCETDWRPAGATPAALEAWKGLVVMCILAEDEQSEFD